MTNVFEGKPDDRQSEDAAMPTSRFRPRYRALSDEDKALHDAIKAKAAELESLFRQIPWQPMPVPLPVEGRGSSLPDPSTPRYLALATTSLEESIMWAVKALTL